jgi:antitoxin YefM
MNKSVRATEAKKKFSELLRQVNAQRGRITIERHGKPVVVLVSIRDLERLEELEKQQSRTAPA